MLFAYAIFMRDRRLPAWARRRIYTQKFTKKEEMKYANL